MVTGRIRVMVPAPASGVTRRVNTIPVQKPQINAAPSMVSPNAASPAQTANISAAQNVSMPPSAIRCRCGRRNSAAASRTESRKTDIRPRHPGRPRSREAYHPAAQKAMTAAGTGMVAHGHVTSAGGRARPRNSTMVDAAHPNSARTPCSMPPNVTARTKDSRGSAPAFCRATSSGVRPRWAKKPLNPAITTASSLRRGSWKPPSAR